VTVEQAEVLTNPKEILQFKDRQAKFAHQPIIRARWPGKRGKHQEQASGVRGVGEKTILKSWVPQALCGDCEFELWSIACQRFFLCGSKTPVPGRGRIQPMAHSVSYRCGRCVVGCPAAYGP
jgi:hypothetical protein